jgi:hypothetical protein
MQRLPVFHSLETCPVQSTVDHIDHLAHFMWGLDLIGPFKKCKGRFTHIFVVVDKFTKWIEAKSAASITVARAVEFICKIMYWFGIPNNKITNNGTQFTTREFRDFYEYVGIKVNYALVSHS